MSELINFPGRARTQKSARPIHSGNAPAPILSLTACLRWSPVTFQPKQVALDLIRAGGNDAAKPIWSARWHAMEKLLSSRGVSGAAAAAIMSEWRARVRSAGIAEKARRRAHEREVIAFLDAQRGGGDVA